jgi:hypothetical protein
MTIFNDRAEFLDRLITMLRARLWMLETVKEPDANLNKKIEGCRKALARLEGVLHDRAA